MPRVLALPSPSRGGTFSIIERISSGARAERGNSAMPDRAARAARAARASMAGTARSVSPTAPPHPREDPPLHDHAALRERKPGGVAPERGRVMRTGSLSCDTTGAAHDAGEYLFEPQQAETVFQYSGTPAPGSGFGGREGECGFRARGVVWGEDWGNSACGDGNSRLVSAVKLGAVVSAELAWRVHALAIGAGWRLSLLVPDSALVVRSVGSRSGPRRFIFHQRLVSCLGLWIRLVFSRLVVFDCGTCPKKGMG
ncbi:hypothetical protein K438DRAFT_1753336 [Mycena galopus ATCC 62051]|nr:hypothetical protein K438DRAFT_1753336 [Mycena galopus ATCC 62051]